MTETADVVKTFVSFRFASFPLLSLPTGRNFRIEAISERLITSATKVNVIVAEHCRNHGA
jgi:hypothetical protein